MDVARCVRCNAALATGAAWCSLCFEAVATVAAPKAVKAVAPAVTPTLAAAMTAALRDEAADIATVTAGTVGLGGPAGLGGPIGPVGVASTAQTLPATTGVPAAPPLFAAPHAGRPAGALPSGAIPAGAVARMAAGAAQTLSPLVTAGTAVLAAPTVPATRPAPAATDGADESATPQEDRHWPCVNCGGLVPMSDSMCPACGAGFMGGANAVIIAPGVPILGTLANKPRGQAFVLALGLGLIVAAILVGLVFLLSAVF